MENSPGSQVLVENQRPQKPIESLAVALAGEKIPGPPQGGNLGRKSGLVSYSTSEIWRVGGMEGVEGERISTPLAVE